MMDLINKNDVKTIGSIGAGPIGAGWVAYFLSQGLSVKAYLHNESEENNFYSMLRTAWVSLKKLYNVKELEETNLEIFFDLSECIKKVDFIQESAPEILSLKQNLYKKLGEIVPKNVIICSSTSGMKMTDIQTLCKTPERTVVAHPFNPPYLLPLVEIVGGKKTKDEAVNWVHDFFIKIGKSPLVLKKEIPGFVATRLQEALWREALHMVNNNEATPEAVAYTINKALAAAGNGWNDITVSYDSVRQGFRFEQTDPAKQYNLYIGSADADAQAIFNVGAFAGTNYGTNVLPADQDLESLLLRDVVPNGSTLSVKNHLLLAL